jgi:hypothetical protein
MRVAASRTRALGNRTEAIRDLQRYLALAPDTADASDAPDKLASLQRG